IWEAVGVEFQQVDVVFPIDDDDFVRNRLLLAVLRPGTAQLVGGRTPQVVLGTGAVRLETGQVLRSTGGEFDQLLRVYIAVEFGQRRHDAGGVFGRLRTGVDDGPVGGGRR